MRKVNVKKNSGISLLELVLSISIIAILLVAATRYFETTQSSARVNEAIKMLQDTKGAIDNWYAIFKKFTGTPEGDISITALAKMALIPNDFNSPTSNPWGGDIKITIQSDQNLQVVLSNVSTADCLNLKEIMAKNNINGTCANNSYIMSYP